MKLKRHTSSIALAVFTVLTTAMPVVSAEGASNERSIQGTWRTVVTPHNCQTGAPFRPLAGQFTFHQGGTMAEYGIGPGSSPALRSPGHGVWQRRHGWQVYSFAFTFYRYDASGVLLGSQKITGDLELGQERRYIRDALGHRGSRCQRRRDRRRLRHRRRDAIRMTWRGAGFVLRGSPAPACCSLLSTQIVRRQLSDAGFGGRMRRYRCVA